MNINQINVNNKFNITHNPQVYIYYTNENNTEIQLTLDWNFDSIYFKYSNTWIILSYGPKGNINQIHKIDNPQKISFFKSVAFHTLNTFKSFSTESENCIKELRKIVDLFV